MSDFTLNAEVRTDLGKGASRRLRHTDKVPAIVYGAGKEPVSITLEHKSVIKATEAEAFYSSIITLNIAGEDTQVLLKDMQRHAFKPKVNHLDFLRVDASVEIQTNVPLHFINEDSAEAVKNGGKPHHLATDIVISCLPKDLPEFIEVDVSAALLDSALHLSDVKLPAGVVSLELSKGDDHDQAIFVINTPKGVDDSEADASAPEADAE
ncbi:50S ribosomal protein L25/general stress protein Ctc [Alginatibacterium sediminis]|uniref:Large ribosomal subunit protein bL25 n=1 Tax=Alginatibacterium sediminis TaxID=2164068 RepID=A0A420E666_9ALTE|nr:50S ribosomal protein L25/general stress protein Ctc [Alginatibacterium sediminis]RKF13636.1 50S ribosomal protein L25/general stress protein Ctc [Alginatibacterium sediminis]